MQTNPTPTAVPYNEEFGLTDKTGDTPQLRSILTHEWEDAQRGVRYFALDWDSYEDLFYVQSRTPDNLHVRVSEGSLSTMIIERSARVVSQVPSGRVNALSIKDQGKSLLMDLLMHKYVFKHANTQWDMKTKLRVWDMKSNLYGVMPMQYDWVVTDNYTGPDCWVVPIRNFFPQQGRISIEDCDFVFISNFISREALMNICENPEDYGDTYNIDIIREVLADTKGKALVPKAEYDYWRRNPMFEIRRRTPWTNTGQFEVVTKYEAGDDGRWISFFADYGAKILRNIPNPHENGKIPVILKPAIPTDDSIISLGDGERGRYIQYAMDTTVNLQVDGQKLRTYPPMMIIEDQVTMPTVRMQPGAKILVDQAESIEFAKLPDNTNVLDLTYQFLKGALSNIVGVTTTQVSADSESPIQGKTPQAIQQQQQQQSTRDEMDRELFEIACEKLFNAFVELINSKQAKPIELYLFGDEIKQIASQGYPDVMDMVKVTTNSNDQNAAAMITIKPDKVKNAKGYRYEIDAGSSMALDQQKQLQSLTQIGQLYLENAAAFEQLLNMGGQTFDFSQWFKEVVIASGINDWQSILRPMATGTMPGQQGASNTGNQPQQKPPGESINYKDVAGTPAGDALLAQAELPPAGAAPMSANPSLPQAMPQAAGTQPPQVPMQPQGMPQQPQMIPQQQPPIGGTAPGMGQGQPPLAFGGPNARQLMAVLAQTHDRFRQIKEKARAGGNQ